MSITHGNLQCLYLDEVGKRYFPRGVNIHHHQFIESCGGKTYMGVGHLKGKLK